MFLLNCLFLTHGSANLGLPGDIPADFADSVFWSLVTGVGQLHTRLVVPYQGHDYSNSNVNTTNCMLSLMIIGGGCRGIFVCEQATTCLLVVVRGNCSGMPWCLAKLLNTQCPREEKEEIANWFCQLRQCCKDKAFSEPFSLQVSSPDELLHSERCQLFLKGFFNCKTCNITIETNFARMGSMKRANRGRCEIVPSLAAKHMLSEAKAIHLHHIKRVRKHQLKHGSTPMSSGGTGSMA